MSSAIKFLSGAAIIVTTSVVGLVASNSCTPAEVTAGTNLASIIFGDLSEALRAKDPRAAGLLALAGYLAKASPNPGEVERALDAMKAGDYSLTYELETRALESLRAQGVQIPPDVDLVLNQTAGLIAANAVQNGMRALSEPRPPSVPPSKPARDAGA